MFCIDRTYFFFFTLLGGQLTFLSRAQPLFALWEKAAGHETTYLTCLLTGGYLFGYLHFYIAE